MEIVGLQGYGSRQVGLTIPGERGDIATDQHAAHQYSQIP